MKANIFFFLLIFIISYGRENEESENWRNKKRIGLDTITTELKYSEWNVPMPKQSLFLGMKPPNNLRKWKRAQHDAMTGKHILFQRIIKTLKQPMVAVDGEIWYKWVHKLTDVFSRTEKDFAESVNEYQGDRAPITLLGYIDFDRMSFEGEPKTFYSNSPNDIISAMRKGTFSIPKPIVAIGQVNENWGWASSYILNRTTTWGYHYDHSGPLTGKCHTEELAPILEHPNVTVVFLNQHHNLSHPKVLSLPRGLYKEHARIIWDIGLSVSARHISKDKDLFTASSSWGSRPDIVKCVRNNIGSMLAEQTSKASVDTFLSRLVESRAVLCLPGLGYDSFRIWETLLSGSMPVLERAIGLDRTLYKLPALLLEDFAELTPLMLRQAYVEALYRVDEWDYRRITQSYWERLIYMVSEAKSIAPLMKLHPMISDPDFTRPMVPYNCSKLGGCGPGTKRTPRKSCAIDFSKDLGSRVYNWDWNK